MTKFLSYLFLSCAVLAGLLRFSLEFESAQDIADSEIDLMEEFELGVILSPARRNGAFSMLKTIKEFSKKLAD